MKISRKTKIRIRKVLAFARVLSLAAFGILALLAACSATMWTLEFAFKCTFGAVVCCGLSCVFNYALFGTIYGRENQ
jgi:hypothetical protein